MSLIPVEKALRRILDGADVLDPEIVPFDHAGGRILATPVLARRTHPPFDNSAMDGYAVRAADVASVPVELTLIGESAAGRRFQGVVQAGQAVRIFTGAPMPDGADTILVQENAERSGQTVTAMQSIEPGRHIRRAGLDFRQGDVLLEAGRLVDSSALALIAAADATTVSVVRRPRVAIIATGDELVEPGQPRSIDQIVASNGYGIAQLVIETGGEPVDLGIVGDDEDAIGARLDEARDCDVIVTLGGASVGDHDLTGKVFAAKGVDLAFWKIAMRPGKPLMAGRLGRANVLGLPGNPVSALVCAHLFVRPLIASLLGTRDDGSQATATLGVDMPANDARQDYVRAVAHRRPNGEIEVRPLPIQDSSMLSGLARANALIVRPPQAPAARVGDATQIVILRPLTAS